LLMIPYAYGSGDLIHQAKECCTMTRPFARDLANKVNSQLTRCGRFVFALFTCAWHCCPTRTKVICMTDTIRIIGIDPGLRRTGWGVIETLGNSLRFVASGTVTSDGDLDLASRLCQLHDGLAEIVHAYQPDEAAVEQTFVNKDAVATLKL